QLGRRLELLLQFAGGERVLRRRRGRLPKDSIGDQVRRGSQLTGAFGGRYGVERLLSVVEIALAVMDQAEGVARELNLWIFGILLHNRLEPLDRLLVQRRQRFGPLRRRRVLLGLAYAEVTVFGERKKRRGKQRALGKSFLEALANLGGFVEIAG